MRNILSTHEMNLFKAGDTRVQNKFFYEYFKALRDFSYSITKDYEESEDIGLKALSGLWFKKEDLHDEETIRKFLFVVVKNASFSFVEKKQRRGPHKELNDDLPVSEENFIRVYDETLAIQIFSDEIRRMPGKPGEVLKRLFFDGQAPKEIATEMNISRNDVAVNKLRGLKKLKKLKKLVKFLCGY